jgi:serine/threonine protein kinase
MADPTAPPSDFHAEASVAIGDSVLPGDGLSDRTLGAPDRLNLEDLSDFDLAYATALEDATMSIRPDLLGDTSIPTIARPIGTFNDNHTLVRPTTEAEAAALTGHALDSNAETPPSLIQMPSRAASDSFDDFAPPLGRHKTPSPDIGFVLGNQVGVGGYGEVFEATQNGLGRTIAVKRLKAENLEIAKQNPATGRWMEFLFQQEAITTALLEHPNIVPIHHFITDGDSRPHLTMKLVKGQSWDKIIETDLGVMSQTDYLTKHLSILIDVSQAVGFAHAHGIVHRDLKPQQVMVGEFGEVILMDWGLALVFDDGLLPSSIRNTPQSDILPRPHDAPSPGGSPAFMAPEQTARTATQVGPWTDIFMLGGILYAILTGTPPHRKNPGQKAGAVFKLAAECNIDPPELRAPDIRIPSELATLAMECLRREPSQRLASATDFIAQIQDYLSGASRRRESRALTDAIALEINEAQDDYRRLSDCDNRLDRALFLWPDNPDGLSLREEVLQLYAEAAMANNDLSLARVQAERLPPHHDARAELLMEISVLENLSSRETLEAREAELALRRADSRRRRTEEVLTKAEQNRIAAVESRAFAESLLEHLINDMVASQTDATDSRPLTPPIASAAARIGAYFDATDAADITDRMIAQRARTCDTLAQSLLQVGQSAEAGHFSRMSQTYLQILQQRETARRKPPA